MVCGKRSCFFEQDTPSSPPPVFKRIRYSSASSLRFSPPATNSSSPSHLDRLAAFFPELDKQFLERALEQYGDDLDSAIRSLTDLCLGSAERLGSATRNSDAAQEANVQIQTPGMTNGEDWSSENPSAPQNRPRDGAEWVELFVTEILGASNRDDRRHRVSRALELLENSICARVTVDAAQGLQQETNMFKEQHQALIQENSILKRAVSIQHERQKEFEVKNQELHNLKQMVSQYQEQLRNLEVNNYALQLHLKQAQQSNSFPWRFHPDVF